MRASVCGFMCVCLCVFEKRHFVIQGKKKRTHCLLCLCSSQLSAEFFPLFPVQLCSCWPMPFDIYLIAVILASGLCKVASKVIWHPAEFTVGKIFVLPLSTVITSPWLLVIMSARWMCTHSEANECCKRLLTTGRRGRILGSSSSTREKKLFIFYLRKAL